MMHSLKIHLQTCDAKVNAETVYCNFCALY